MKYAIFAKIWVLSYPFLSNFNFKSLIINNKTN